MDRRPQNSTEGLQGLRQGNAGPAGPLGPWAQLGPVAGLGTSSLSLLLHPDYLTASSGPLSAGRQGVREGSGPQGPGRGRLSNPVQGHPGFTRQWHQPDWLWASVTLRRLGYPQGPVCCLSASQPSPTAGCLLLSGLFSTSFSQDGHPGQLSSAPASSEAGGCWRPCPKPPPRKCRKAIGSLWILCPGSALYRQLPTYQEASGNQPGQIWVPEKSPMSTYAHTTPDGTQGGLVSKSPHPAQAGPAAGGHPDTLPGGGPGPGTSLHTEQS